MLLLISICLLGSSAQALDQINIMISHPPNTPYFIGMPEFNIDAEEFSTIVLKIKSNQSGTARLFWASSYDPQMNEPKSIWFSLDKTDYFKSYYFNVRSQNPSWIGFIGQILIFPENGPEGIELESAQAITGNFITDIKSGWQEFWGPKGRVVIGSTINVIPSSNIFGTSVNIYIYWIIGIFFVVYFLVRYFQLPETKKSKAPRIYLVFAETAKRTLFLSIALWILLALNADYNYFNIFKDDYSKYFGKTIEQKRAIAYGKDYYDFLVFAKEKLPKAPIQFGLLSSRYAASLQARIYLVPHIFNDALSQSSYLLVFHPDQKELAAQKGFSLLAKLNDNAYILHQKPATERRGFQRQ